MRTRNNFIEKSWTNNIGQTLQPGDEVVAVTKSWGQIRTYKGRYDGVYINAKGQVAAVCVFGATKTMYKRDGERSAVIRKYVTDPVTGQYVRDPVTGFTAFTEVTRMVPKYTPYKRVVATALPCKRVYRIA